MIECDLVKLGKNAAQVASMEFSAQSMSNRYREFYRRLLSEK